MPVVTCNPIGRFGNNMFHYAFARAYAEKHGHDFQCDPWVGQKIFKLNDARITNRNLPPKSDLEVNGQGDIEIRTYGQSQNALIYTRSQVREWFKLWPEIATSLPCPSPIEPIIAHRRVGDYIGYGYVLVSEESYYLACKKFGYDPRALAWSTEENPTLLHGIPPEMSFVTDFLRMFRANILFRGNSSFSWWAAVLGNAQRVFSPVIEGLEGGKEHDVEFVEGNWPRFANLAFVTDLHLPP